MWTYLYRQLRHRPEQNNTRKLSSQTSFHSLMEETMSHFQYKKKFRLNHCVKVMNIYSPSVEGTMVNFTKRQKKTFYLVDLLGPLKNCDHSYIGIYKPITRALSVCPCVCLLHLRLKTILFIIKNK